MAKVDPPNRVCSKRLQVLVKLVRRLCIRRRGNMLNAKAPTELPERNLTGNNMTGVKSCAQH
jgi:hypothetical protein